MNKQLIFYSSNMYFDSNMCIKLQIPKFHNERVTETNNPKKHHTWNSWGHTPLQSSHSSHSNILGGVLGCAGLACSHHVGLQESPLQEDIVIRQGFVAESKDLFCDFLCSGQVVITIWQNFRLNNGDNAILYIKMCYTIAISYGFTETIQGMTQLSLLLAIRKSGLKNSYPKMIINSTVRYNHTHIMC